MALYMVHVTVTLKAVHGVYRALWGPHGDFGMQGRSGGRFMGGLVFFSTFLLRDFVFGLGGPQYRRTRYVKNMFRQDVRTFHARVQFGCKM